MSERADPTDDAGLVLGDDGIVYEVASDGTRTPLNSGSSAVLIHSTTLSTAQLLAANTATVECLPAPGGRYYYDVQHVVWHLRYGTTPFTGVFTDLALGFYAAGGLFPLYNPASAATLISPPTLNHIGFDPLAQTEDVYVYSPKPQINQDGIGWLASAIENMPLSIGLANFSSDPNPAAAWTGGDGSLTVRVLYSLINGAG